MGFNVERRRKVHLDGLARGRRHNPDTLYAGWIVAWVVRGHDVTAGAGICQGHLSTTAWG